MEILYNTDEMLFTLEEAKELYTDGLLTNNKSVDNVNDAFDLAVDKMNNKGEKHRIALDSISSAVAEVLDINEWLLDVVRFPSREKEVALGRHLFSYLSYMYTAESLEEIAFYLGYTRHAQAIYGRDRISRDLQHSQPLQWKLNAIKHLLKKRGYDVSVVKRNNAQKEWTTQYLKYHRKNRQNGVSRN